jgi:hypothetical protein
MARSFSKVSKINLRLRRVAVDGSKISNAGLSELEEYYISISSSLDDTEADFD